MKLSKTLSGKTKSIEHREKLRRAQLGRKDSKAQSWKGDKAGYHALHKHVREYLTKPDLCEFCHLVQPTEVACITRVYNRKLENWKWLCIKCHRSYDNNKINLHPHKPIDMSDYKCYICGSDKTYIFKLTGRPHWYYMNENTVCKKCYMKDYDRFKRKKIR